MKFTVSDVFYIVALVGSICLVQSSPVKVSRPQAITALNLTQEQAETLIEENPTRASILQAPDPFLPPSLPLYLPDPERNKSTDDFYLLATYSTADDKSDDNPVKLPLSLDTFVRPPPLPSADSKPIDFHSDQSDKEKSAYSYNDRYDYYFPVKVVYDDKQKYGEQELQLMEMQPPVQSNEPNYYEYKPKKVPKKYQPNKKDVNHFHHKSNGDGGAGLVPIDNDGLVLDTVHTPFVTSQPVERFAPAPSYRDLTPDDLNTGEYIPKYKTLEQNTEAISLPQTAASNQVAKKLQSGEFNDDGDDDDQSKSDKFQNDDGVDDDDDDDDDDDYESSELNETAVGDTENDANKRVEFQMHGFNGPNSYTFGYDTGLGKERQFRVEQRDADGSIRGKYGYVDESGKVHLTKYRASEAEGFKAEEVSK